MSEKWIGKLSVKLEKWLRKKLGERKARRYSEGIAAILILAADYGAGNAVAGMMLRKLGRGVDKVVEMLNGIGCGIAIPRTLPPQQRAVLLLHEIASCIDDDDARSAVEGLEEYSLSGGRRAPSWAEERDH